MKVAQINITSQGSTGRIMREIHEITIQKGMECKSFHGRGKVMDDANFIKFGTERSFVFHVLITFITNKQGHYARSQTKKLIAHLDAYQPDVIHLHNVHGYYLHYPMFFDWLIHQYTGKIIWTMHDCWAITGHCSHFVKAACDKWKTGCDKCPQSHAYPFSFFVDTSKSEYALKKKLFTSLDSLVITTPSQWMAKLIKNSYLQAFPVHVVNNWTPIQEFTPTYDTCVLEKFSIASDKKIVLGVANIWEERKGFNIFMELSKKLADDYQIVMVGLNKRQIRKLPSTIKGIERTTNVHELAALYSLAYVFLNPSIEESFSLVTLEALACNTPVIVQDSSAVHEMVNEYAGFVMSDFNIDTYLQYIMDVKQIDRENEKIRKSVLKYNKEDKINQFIQLYEEGEK